MHALDLASGNEKFNGPVEISASVAGTGYDSSNSVVTFDSRMENQRAALALVNGVVYLAWASHENADPYHGWVIGYNAGNLSQTTAYCTTANGHKGGVWMAGGGPAADSSGNVYVSTGNGGFDDTVSNLGDTILKLSTTAGLAVSDWFTPFDQSTLESQDLDLGSGGVVLLPDQISGPAHLMVGGGKEGALYLLNRDSMGHFCSSCNTTTGDNNVVQSFHAIRAIFGTPAFWQNGLYLGGVSDKLSLFRFNPATGLFDSSPASQSSLIYGFPGATPSISSQASSNGIVWAIDSSQFGVPKNAGGPAVLHAYDANDLETERWNSLQAPGNRDQAGQAVKFTVPTVANGRVYIGTQTTVEVYGLLPN